MPIENKYYSDSEPLVKNGALDLGAAERNGKGKADSILHFLEIYNDTKDGLLAYSADKEHNEENFLFL